MSERDPFERLGDLADQPVAPHARFADDLKSQLMSGLAASSHDRSWKEEHQLVDITYRPSPVVMPERTHKRRFKPLMLLEIAAVAALLIGIAAAIAGGKFSSNPDDPATIPAAALQDDSAATPTVVPPAGTMEPTVAPPAGLLWQLPLPAGESLDLGGMVVHDGVIYRLLATSSFAGVEAVDSATGGVLWKEKHSWSEFKLLADDDHVYFLQKLSGAGFTKVVALDAGSGEESWTLELDGFPLGIVLQDGVLFVEENRNVLKAIRDGGVLWEQFIDPNDNRRQLSQIVYGINDPVTDEEKVVAMSETGIIGGFDISTGERLWSSDASYAADTLLTISGDTLVLFHSVAPAVSSTESGAAQETAVGEPDNAQQAQAEAGGASGTPGAGPEQGAASGVTTSIDARTVARGEQLSEPGAQWRVTGVNLDDGAELWSHNISGLVGRIAVIDDTVAYITVRVDGDDSATPVVVHNTTLYGLDANSGDVVWSVSSGETFFGQLGSWFPNDGWQELFVVSEIAVEGTGNNLVVTDGSLTVVDPHSQGRTEGVEIDLEQLVISVPQGDQNGLYLTLQDGTLIALPSATVIDRE